MAPNSTSSTCPGTTGWSATCWSGPARSMRRCSSLPPTTDRAPRRSSIWRCSTRSGSATGWRSSRRRTSPGRSATAEVVAAVERLLDGTTLAGSPVLAVSSVDGEGVEAIRAALVRLRDRVLESSASAADRPSGSRLAIDRVFSVKGRGAVVTGTLRGRPSAGGTTLRLVPGDRSVRVREIQVHGTEPSALPNPGEPRSTSPARRSATCIGAWS